MKAQKIFKIFSFVVAPLAFIVPVLVSAQTQITIATSVPGTYGPKPGTGGPGAFVANFYQFSLIIAGVLAFGVIVYGGIRYMTSAGNPSGASDAKEWIEAALLGLLLLAGAYFILKVINPQLLNLQLPTLTQINIPAPTTSGGGGGGSTTNPTTGVGGGGALTAVQAQAQLNANGVQIAPGIQIAGLQQGTVNDVDALAAQCAQQNGGSSCNLVMTSATGGSHASGQCSHTNGYKADLRSSNSASLNSFITNLPKGPVRSDGAQLYYYGGGTIADERNLSGVPPHWDLSAACP